MSWIEKLYTTYENNLTHVGDRNYEIPLLPVCHTTQKAQINVVVDGNGNFIRASVVPKTDARTIIPATEESAGRTRGYVPHPLCDKLQYVAGDYVKYGGDKPSGYEKYVKNLDAWCSSLYTHKKVRAVLTYVRKGGLVQDLVSSKVIHIDEEGILLDKWTGKKDEAPDIFKVIQGEGGLSVAFIRFSVEASGDPQSNLWTDSSVWKSWADYYTSTKSTRGLCYVTGGDEFLADQHPKKIRNDGDGAKLISSNDTTGYTFLGRFTTADEACGVGFEVTQKAHNALRWLIARQGQRDGDQAIVAWAVSGVEVPDPLADTFSLLFGGEQTGPPMQHSYTAQEVGIALSKRIAGYSVKLGSTADVVVLGLDSATPGRMAISYYRELTGSEFLERVQTWHEGCCWLQKFSNEKVFVGAPSPRDIAETAYGTWRDGKLYLDEKLRKSTVERLLPCIIDKASIPRDLLESCARRASNRFGIAPWGWEKALGIACALYRYQHKERSYTMALERERKTRDYLYGRLLALAEHMESRALFVGGEKRATNAEKLMQRFAERPQSTWLILETGLAPYQVRLSAKRPAFLYFVKQEIDTVIDSFQVDDFVSDKRLAGEFLLGYHCQRAALRPDPVQNATEKEDESEEETQK